ncbi:HNH endonuclease [uncultured Legionella sp.]|uniref:HNH endonuclease n=1 Tax=uncultured Legionella sp. TaxID=210934 RepID=UPI0026288B4A|nr:HNH endonuclease [uncultured Legionella sp.]
MERKYPLKDVKKLYANSAGRCAMPTCRLKLILPNTQPSDKGIQIGEIAHIIAHSPTGPRHNSEFAKEKLDTYDNRILLCPTCHQTVDAQESQYSVEKLHQIKAGHEIWVHERLDESMSEVTFAELEIAAKAIAAGHHFHDGSFHVIPPAEKIKKMDYLKKQHH